MRQRSSYPKPLKVQVVQKGVLPGRLLCSLSEVEEPLWLCSGETAHRVAAVAQDGRTGKDPGRTVVHPHGPG